MLDITIDEIKQITNLTDLKRDNVITSKFALINELIKEITTKNIYKKVMAKTKNKNQLLMTLFKTAFAYFVYAECIDLLNTNTSGTGIIASTGFADSRTELLRQDETQKRRNYLEFKGYSTIKKYLNDTGIKRYNDLKLWDDLQRTNDSEARKQLFANKQNTRIRAKII